MYAVIYKYKLTHKAIFNISKVFKRIRKSCFKFKLAQVVFRFLLKFILFLKMINFSQDFPQLPHFQVLAEQRLV